MRVVELKALARERGLRSYSWLRKAELIALLCPAPRTRPAVPGDPLHRGPREFNELNRKIRHSRKKHDGMIHKRKSDRGP